MSAAAEAAGTRGAGKYLTVTLDREAYGIPVLRVREIIRLPAITSVPALPAHVKGVINLRGRVIPVLDLRLKLGLPARNTERTCVVVIHAATSAGALAPMGIVIDEVEEVANVTASQIEPPPAGGSGDGGYLTGVAKVEGRVKLLLDLDRVLAA